MKKYDVAVFVHKYEDLKKKLPYQVLAYLRDYSSEWPGYNFVRVFAKNGTEAKSRAIKIVKKQLEIDPSIINISTL